MQKQEDTLDTLVRDLTTVHPMPKSEVRRRLSDFIECAKAERDEEIREFWKRIKVDEKKIAIYGQWQAETYEEKMLVNAVIDQTFINLINFLSTPPASPSGVQE